MSFVQTIVKIYNMVLNTYTINKRPVSPANCALSFAISLEWQDKHKAPGRSFIVSSPKLQDTLQSCRTS
jgi:hypothetical protein